MAVRWTLPATETETPLSTATEPMPTMEEMLPPTMAQKTIRVRWAAVWAVKAEWDRAAVDINLRCQLLPVFGEDFLLYSNIRRFDYQNC